jgi:hypothetical protein
MKIQKEDIYEYMRNINFDEGLILLQDLASVINRNIEQENMMKEITIDKDLFNLSNMKNPYRIKIDLEDITKTVNIGDFFLERLEVEKQNEYNFANSLSYHDRLAYDKFHKD